MAFSDLFRLVKKPEPKAEIKEYGKSGVEFFSGLISGQEYLTELTGKKAVVVYDKMRRADAQIRGTMYAVTLPIRQAKFYVDAVSDSPLDIEVAETINDNLMNGMAITWDDALRQALLYLTFGFSVFEKVWAVQDGKVKLLKLAPRIQKTIERWNTNPDGTLDTVQQYTQTSDGGRFEYINIPAKKIIVFTNDMEGNNFEGISVLRSSYRHWYIKDQLYKIDAIGHDRFASGTPWMQEPQAANQGDVNRVKTILAEMKSRDRSYVTIPYGWQFGILEKSGNNDSLMNSIKHHNEEISKNIMAQFINLGTTESGSRSLGESFEEMFVMSLNTIAGYICDVLNRQLIKEYVDYNWKVKEYPVMRHSRIMLNTSKYMEMLGKIGLSNLITKDTGIENQARELLGFPELSPEQIAEQENKDEIETDIPDNNQPAADKVESAKPDDVTEEDMSATDKSHTHKLAGKGKRRELSEIEKQCADIGSIEHWMDYSEEKTKTQIEKIRDQQIRYVSQHIFKDAPEDIKVPYQGKLADRIYDEMKKAYRRGGLSLKEEIKRQKQIVKKIKLTDEPILDDELETNDEARKYLKEKAHYGATLVSLGLLKSAIFALYNLDVTGKSNAEKEAAMAAALKDAQKQDVQNVAAMTSVNAYTLGREIAAKSLTEQIEYAVYSAVLDDSTCANCQPKDGVEHEIDDPSYRTPNPECLGGSRCRCINVYKIKGQEIEMMAATEPRGA